MGQFTSDSSDVARLAQDLKAAGVELDELDGPNAEAGRTVLAAARPPRRSGALAASLRADVTRTGVVFASTARYWTFVHYGAPGHNVRARPWYPQAIAASTSDVVAVYATHMKRTTDKIGT